MTGVRVREDQLSTRDGTRKAGLGHLALAAQPCQGLEKLEGCTGRSNLNPDPPRTVSDRDLRVRRTGGYLDRIALTEQMLLPVDRDLHRARDHLDALDLPGVDVTLLEEAGGSPDHLHLEQLSPVSDPVRRTSTRIPSCSISSTSCGFAMCHLV